MFYFHTLLYFCIQSSLTFVIVYIYVYIDTAYYTHLNPICFHFSTHEHYEDKFNKEHLFIIII